MPRYERFTFLCSHKERQMLAALAKRLNRSQSDTIRLLIREADRNLLSQAHLVQARVQWLTEARFKLLQLFPVVSKLLVDVAQTSEIGPFVTLAVYIALVLTLFWPDVR